VIGLVLSMAEDMRRSGVQVSQGEILDAFEALSRIAPGDRATLYLILKATLVKNWRDFDVFESSFKMATRPLPQPSTAREPETRDVIFRGTRITLDPRERKALAMLPRETRSSLLGVVERAERLPSGGNLLPAVRLFLRDSLNKVAEGTLGSKTQEPPKGVYYKDLMSLEGDEMERAEEAVAVLARHLARAVSRRSFRGPGRAGLDFRSTFRRSLRYGGVPLELSPKRDRRRVHRVVLLCDVSGSMDRYSGFTVALMHGMARCLKGLKVFVFSEDMTPVPGHLFSARPGSTLSRLSSASLGWGQGTNLKGALEKLLKEYPESLSRRDTVMLLSDGKCLDLPGAARALQEVSSRVGRVVWLNPVPKEYWAYFKGVDVRSCCQMHECSTLNHLESVAKALFVP